jgi:CheY-like chemotaxis protein
VLTRIFNPFFTTKEKGKGTGLGLAIVHNVISKAGGIIEVDTVVGQGTTFHVFLPAVLDEHPVAAKMPGARMARGSGNVMIVDDLELVCDFATRFLQAAGYDVFCAMSVDEALKILDRRQGKMDLILTDYSMPGKTGLQLIDIVKQQYPAIKLILATGYLEDKERSLIEKTYQIGILNKPYNISEASDLISRTIQQA